MTSLILIVAVAFAIGVFAFGWRHDSARTLIVTPFALLGINIVVRDLPPALLASAPGNSSDFHAAAIVLTSLVMFVFGFILVAGVTGYAARHPVMYRSAPVLVGDQNAYAVAVLFAAIFLASAGLMFYGGLPPVSQALIQLMQGDATAAVAKFVGQSRKLITKGHYLGGEYRGAGILLTLMGVGWPFLLAISAILYSQTRSRLWLVMGAILTLCTFIFVAGDGTRGPFLWSLLYVLIVMSWVVRIRPRLIAFTAAGIVAVAISLSLVSPKLQNAEAEHGVLRSGVEQIAQRILLDNGANSVAIMELVNSGTWDHRYGAVHLQRVRAAIPGKDDAVPLSRQVFLARNPSSSAPTYASSTYVGDVFLDFGWIGVAMVYFLLGGVVAAVQVAIGQAYKTVLTLPFLGLVILNLGRVSLVGPVGFLSQMVVGCCVFILVWGAYIAARTLAAPRTRELRTVLPASAP